MPLHFDRVTVKIPRGTRQKQFDWESHEFPSEVVRDRVGNERVNLALNGFKLQYDDPDHEIKVMEVDTHPLFVDPQLNKLVFRVWCDLADKNDDDSYSGYIDVLVIAEVE